MGQRSGNIERDELIEIKGGIKNGKDTSTELQYGKRQEHDAYVDEPRADLTTPAVEAAMQAVIASGVFEMDGFPLETSKGARIVERNVTEIVDD